MITTKISGLYHFYPSTVTLVGAKHKGQVNYMAAAWNTVLSFDPPLFGVSIAPKRFTHHMIAETGEFTCNFLTADHLDIVHGSGTLSGGDVDKIEKLGIKTTDSITIECPIIAASYAAYECKLMHTYKVGDHDLFVGEVTAIHQDDDILDKDGILDSESLPFSMYIGTNTYISADPSTKKKM